MKKAAKNKGTSHFARSKSLKEQRQYLPAFASREALLKIVRENQGASVLPVPVSKGREEAEEALSSLLLSLLRARGRAVY